jgi:hypothetical protein
VPTLNCIDANSGAIQELEVQMKTDLDNVVAKIPTSEIEDSGKVRIGDYSPHFPPLRAKPPVAKDRG